MWTQTILYINAVHPVWLRKHLYDRIISFKAKGKVLSHKTSSTQPLCIEVSVQGQVNVSVLLLFLLFFYSIMELFQYCDVFSFSFYHNLWVAWSSFYWVSYILDNYLTWSKLPLQPLGIGSGPSFSGFLCTLIVLSVWSTYISFY